MPFKKSAVVPNFTMFFTHLLFFVNLRIGLERSSSEYTITLLIIFYSNKALSIVLFFCSVHIGT